MGVSISELEKAIKSIEEAVDLYNNANTDSERRAFRDAAIQRFEFSIELSWKTSMKILGSTTAAAKNAVREMARSNLIDDIESWMKFLDGRNETPHSYDEEVARKVCLIVCDFIPFAQKLLLQLNKAQI